MGTTERLSLRRFGATRGVSTIARSLNRPWPQSGISFRWLVIIVFAVFVCLNYYPVFFGRIPLPRDVILNFPPWSSYSKPPDVQRTAEIGDIVAAFYPFRTLAARAVREGTLPLWNPYIMSGTSFVGNGQSAMFYPLNFLVYVLPLPTAWTLLLMLRMFLAGLFMTLLIRSVGGSKTGSIISGIVFASCGFLTAWQGQPMGDAAIWLPFICYSVHRLQSDFSGFSVALAGIAFAMPVLAGHPETAAHLALAGIVTAFVLWLWPYERAGRGFDNRFILRFGFAGVLAIGLASIQMLPTLEWIGQLGDALQGTWPTWRPHEIYGLFSRDVFANPNSAGLIVPEAAAYVGMITLLAAALAPFHKAKRSAVLFAILTFLAGSVAYSIEPVRSIVFHLPVIKAIKNQRLILVMTFGLAGLAGLGVSAIEQGGIRTSRQKRWALALLSAAFLLSLLLVYRLQKDAHSQVELMQRPSFSAILLVLSAIPIVWRLVGGLPGRAFPITIGAVVCFDLLTFGHGYTGFTRVRDVFPASPVFDFLVKNADPGQFRIISVGATYPVNSPLMYGLSAADGYDGASQRMRLFTSGLGDQSAFVISFSEEGIVRSNDRRVDLLNVKYIAGSPYSPNFGLLANRQNFVKVLDAGDTVIFENKSVLPRAFAVPATGMEVLNDFPSQLARLREPAFNPEQSVVLASKPAFIGNAESGANSTLFETHVEVTDSQINEVTVNSRVSQNAILVIAQTYFPGWKATVDGNNVEVFPADLALTGLLVPPGDHQVRLFYSPSSFKIGAGLSLTSVVILLVLITFSYKRSQRADSQNRSIR